MHMTDMIANFSQAKAEDRRTDFTPAKATSCFVMLSIIKLDEK